MRSERYCANTCRHRLCSKCGLATHDHIAPTWGAGVLRMVIRHRVSFSPHLREEVVPAFERLGVRYDKEWLSVEISEDSACWPEFYRLLEMHKEWTTCSSDFPEAALRNAQWLHLSRASRTADAFPYPKEHFGYLKLSYDLSRYCESCGVGHIQIRPLRLPRAAVPADADLFGIHWEVEETFVRSSVWERVFAPLGVPCWEVICEETQTTFDSIVQLRVDLHSHLQLRIDVSWPRATCACCGRVKFDPHVLARFHPVQAVYGASPLVKTMEWFGSGGEARQRTLVNQALCRKLLDAKVRGMRLRPVGD